MTKGLGVSQALLDYVAAHSSLHGDDVERRLIERTRALGPVAGMLIAPEQGAFMTLLARAVRARHAIEIGTFTGYSALALARGLPPDGTLLCLDISEEWTALAREFWREAGVAERITLQLGPAAETLAALPARAHFDLAFIDADKTGYENYLELLHPRLNDGALVLVDNVLWNGQVLDAADQSPDTVALRAFNNAVAKDPRWDCALLPFSDGLTLLRKR